MERLETKIADYFNGLNHGGGDIFCTCPDWPWGPPSLLYNGFWVLFLFYKARNYYKFVDEKVVIACKWDKKAVTSKSTA